MADTDASRRKLLKASAVGAAGVSLGAAGTWGVLRHSSGGHSASDELAAGDNPGADARAAGVGTARHPFYGAHQAGLDTPLPAHAVFISLMLREGSTRESLRRMLRILSDDAARLTQGQVPLADTEPELAKKPAALTVTFGVGERCAAIAGVQAPHWLKPLPAFAIDKLEDRYSGGDVLVMIMSDDPLTLAHAQRMILKDARSFAEIAWLQRGFRNAAGTVANSATQRNLFGQLDGTVNPAVEDYDSLVWIQGGWLRGGCSMVIRRIAMDVDEWDRIDRVGREFSIGRTLAHGAPLAGGDHEHAEPDFSAKDEQGFPRIDNYAHIRRARLDDTGKRNERQQIVRRPFNYDDGPQGHSISNSGQIFVSLQQDVLEQFLPIQQRLADGDLLNTWTTPIGSAVFAILPGAREGGFVGETLFSNELS